jgi:cytochrome P450
MSTETLFRQITDYASRADPYPLYGKLRATRVARQDDGTYVVSRYRDIVALLHDPRISSDPGSRSGATAEPAPAETEIERAFIAHDPPEHDRLRGLTMRQFGPPSTPNLVAAMEDELGRIVDELIDNCQGRTRIDIVEDVSYPFPVRVICKLLGVPREDEPRFHEWAETLVATLDAQHQANGKDAVRRHQEALASLDAYLGELVEVRRHDPGPDLLSRLATDDGPEGRLSDAALRRTGQLLLVAGHETTVNLITNGMLTLLRNPDLLERLRREDELAAPLVEELLRYEPPVQFLPQRSALTDIVVGDTTIPKGAPLVLLLAAGSRDPDRFADPDRFDPDRADNQHLGFGSGIHYCFGAPLARLEVQLALTRLARRLDHPRLVADPPPYRVSPVLRGPRQLMVDIDRVRERDGA